MQSNAIALCNLSCTVVIVTINRSNMEKITINLCSDCEEYLADAIANEQVNHKQTSIETITIHYNMPYKHCYFYRDNLDEHEDAQELSRKQSNDESWDD